MTILIRDGKTKTWTIQDIDSMRIMLLESCGLALSTNAEGWPAW